MKSTKISLGLALGISLVLLLIACGGGGGGSSSSSSSASVTYTGKTAAATITSANAPLVANSVSDGLDESGSSRATLSASNTSNSMPTAKDIINRVATRTRQSAENNLKGIRYASAAQTDAGTEYGSCGGTFVYSYTIDDVTGNFSGTERYSNFCDAGLTFNGSGTISGKLDLVALELINVSLNTAYLSVSAGADKVEMAFSFTLAFTPNSGAPTSDAMTLTCTLKDSAGNMFKIDNMSFSTLYGVGYMDEMLTGDFYDSVEGRVSLSTPVTVRTSDIDLNPSSGELVITGGNASIKVTFLSATTYNLSLDNDLNGTYEEDMGTFTW